MATARRATTMTMMATARSYDDGDGATENGDNDDGDGATGDEVDDDGDGVTGDDVDDDDDGATGDEVDDDDDGATGDEVDDDGDGATGAGNDDGDDDDGGDDGDDDGGGGDNHVGGDERSLLTKQRCRPAREFSGGGWELWTPRPLTPRPLTARFGHHPPQPYVQLVRRAGGGNSRRAIGRHDFHRVGHDSGVFCVVGEVGLP